MTLSLDLWLKICSAASHRRQLSRWIHRFVHAWRYAHTRTTHWAQILRGMRIAGVTTKDFLTLESFSGIRREWLSCPKDWVFALSEPHAIQTIGVILNECFAGLWGVCG